MAPPRNLQRRDALADAAIAILGTSGSHALSHRAADERAGLPPGTASNYFPGRDDLLAAAASRVAALQLAEMAAADGAAPVPVGQAGLAELIGESLYAAATRHRVRYLAVFELTLESTRRPALARELAQLSTAALDFTVAQHRALGLPTSPEQVQALTVLYTGTLLTLVTAPPQTVSREAVLALARSLVLGVLGAGS